MSMLFWILKTEKELRRLHHPGVQYRSNILFRMLSVHISIQRRPDFDCSTWWKDIQHEKHTKADRDRSCTQPDEPVHVYLDMFTTVVTFTMTPFSSVGMKLIWLMQLLNKSGWCARLCHKLHIRFDLFTGRHSTNIQLVSHCLQCSPTIDSFLCFKEWTSYLYRVLFKRRRAHEALCCLYSSSYKITNQAICEWEKGRLMRRCSAPLDRQRMEGEF